MFWKVHRNCLWELRQLIEAHFTDSARWEVTFHLTKSHPTNYDTNYISKRKKTLTCDAFGHINILPDITSPINVIRVHEYITDIDSLTSYLRY